MGWLSIVAGIGAVVLFFFGEHTVLAGLAGISTAGSFWAHGVMHNFATESARRPRSFEGGFCDFNDRDLDADPNRLALANMATSLACFVPLIAAIIIALI